MNKVFLKAPGLSELYNQKLIHNSHLKKLQKIKQTRKTQLSFDNNRNQLINAIRKQKSKTFALNFNYEHDQINKSNIYILKKIGTVKPSSAIQRRIKSSDEKLLNLSNRSRISMKEKQKQEIKQKQNMRLFVKIKTAESKLRPQKLLLDYQNTQKIKMRLMRYQHDPKDSGRIGLKSQRLMTMKGSYLSDRSPLNSQIKNKSVQFKRKSTTAQHYKHQDITKNSLKNINKRYNTIIDALQNKNTIQNQQQTFLTLHNQKNIVKNKLSAVVQQKDKNYNTLTQINQKILHKKYEDKRSLSKIYCLKDNFTKLKEKQMISKNNKNQEPNKISYKNKIKINLS